MQLLKRNVLVGLLLAAGVLAAGLVARPLLAPRPDGSSNPAVQESGQSAPAAAATESGRRGPPLARSGIATEAQPAVSAPDTSPPAVEERLREAVRYLASDELAGRGPGTKGIDLAAEYIAEQFRSAGLRTDNYNGTPFQQFLLSSRLALGSPNRAALVGPDGKEKPLRLAVDFTPISLSRSGACDAPLAFVGYGVTAPELGYDDYAGQDVAGKAVIVLRRKPQQVDPLSRFNDPRHAEHGTLTRKVANAAAHGAAAVIFCTDSHSLALRGPAGKPSAENLPHDNDPLMSFDVRAGLAKRQVFVLHVRRAMIEPLIGAARATSLAELERAIDESLKPQSFDIPAWKMRGEVTLRRQGSLKNVVGVLDGQGPLREEAIVAGAHYDHLGMGRAGPRGSRGAAIYHGADDNASGTAVLVEVGRQLAGRSPPLKRRVVFVAFSAEELGLVGSEHYVRSPLVPMSQTVAMINLDMVGRLRRDTLIVYGTETAAEFPRLIASRAAAQGLRVHTSQWDLGLSDHESFQSQGIPAMHFFTGLHSDYHMPSDVYEKLNYEGMSRIAGLVAAVTAELANAPRRPRARASEWLLAMGGGPRPRSPEGQSGEAYLGVQEKAEDRQGGFLVAGVRRDSPAERAGLRPGDRILTIDGRPVTNMQELKAVVGRRKPGEKAPLVARRDEIDLQLEVTLGTRP